MWYIENELEVEVEEARATPPPPEEPPAGNCFYFDIYGAEPNSPITLDLGIKPEPKALNPKYPNPYPFSPKPVTQINPAGNEIEYPN
jgi:hypothetical protein